MPHLASRVLNPRFVRHISDSARAVGWSGALAACAAIALCAGYLTKSAAQSAKDTSVAAGTNSGTSNASPIYGVEVPAGYRDWKMIAVDQLLIEGKTDQFRAQLGNDIAIRAFKEGTRPFPDGSAIAAIHWTRVPSEENNKVLNGPFPGARSLVVGSTINVQFMVKDSKKYASTGGWGFADFKDGKPQGRELHETCFACHVPAKDNDFVYTRYAGVQ